MMLESSTSSSGCHLWHSLIIIQPSGTDLMSVIVPSIGPCYNQHPEISSISVLQDRTPEGQGAKSKQQQVRGQHGWDSCSGQAIPGLYSPLDISTMIWSYDFDGSIHSDHWAHSRCFHQQTSCIYYAIYCRNTKHHYISNISSMER